MTRRATPAAPARRAASLARWVLAPALLAAPVAALAAEGGEQGNNVFAGDIGNALWTIVIFGFLLVVLGKYAWGPVLKSLQKREDFIRESLAKAKRERDEAEARLREYHEKLSAAHVEATAIIEESRRHAESVKHRIEEEARHESEKMIARAKQEISTATVAATKELYTVAAQLATELAARIVGRELAPQDHERLLAESIAELGRLEPAAPGRPGGPPGSPPGGRPS